MARKDAIAGGESLSIISSTAVGTLFPRFMLLVVTALVALLLLFLVRLARCFMMKKPLPARWLARQAQQGWQERLREVCAATNDARQQQYSTALA